MHLNETCQAAVDECLSLAERVETLAGKMPGYFGTAQGGTGQGYGRDYDDIASILFMMRRQLAQIEEYVHPINRPERG